MAERIPLSTAIRALLRCYLTSDHVSDATGLDPAVQISKNGGAFANPAAGATVATEIANGWYYVDLGTDDTDTLGPLIVRATHATMDTCDLAYNVVAANIPANVTQWLGTACHAATVNGIPVVQVHNASGGVDAPTNFEDMSITDTTGLVACASTQKVDIETIKTQAVTCAAGVTVLANVGFAGAPGANNGAPTTNGAKLNQTVDLTAGQSIACADKTGFSLSATGADLILKSSTFIQAIVAAINEFATYGLTALNTLLVTTGIKAASVPNVTLANGAHGGAGATITTSSGELGALAAAIDAKTTNLPGDPADEHLIIAATDAIMSRIGVAGAGLTALGDARLANLDATISSRTKPADTQAAVTTVTSVTNGVTVSDKTGFKLASDGLDTVAAPTDVTSDANARSSFVKMFRAIFNRFFDAVTQTSTQQIIRNDSGTAISTMTVSDDGVTQSKGKSV